jgi:hypothetical protein
MASARDNLCAALKIDCFAPKPAPESPEAQDLEAGHDDELDHGPRAATPIQEPRPPASLRRSPSDEPYLEPREERGPSALVKIAHTSTAVPAFVSLMFFQMMAMVGWMMMAMASRAVRVFYAAANQPRMLEDDGGAALPLHEAPRPQPAWVRAAPPAEGTLETEFSFAPAEEAD